MRSVIKRDQVRVDEPGAARGARAAGNKDGREQALEHAGPRARLVELDGGVQALEFTCSCGVVSLIEIQCEKKP